MEAVRFAWGEYDVGFAGGLYRACRLAGGDLLSGTTPGELAIAIQADWGGRS